MGDVPRCTWGALTGQTFRLHAFWSTSASKTGFRQNFGPVKSAFDRPFAQTLVHFAFLRFRAIGRSTEPNIYYGKLLLVNRPIKTVKSAHNTGFWRLARASSGGLGVAV